MENENNTEGQKLFHSVCEVNIDGKMSLLSFYDDLPHFEYDMTIDNVCIMLVNWIKLDIRVLNILKLNGTKQFKLLQMLSSVFWIEFLFKRAIVAIIDFCTF